MTRPCPSCGEEAEGKFCAGCGAPLEGATCLACRAPLTPGAKFCHRCGTRAGAGAAAATAPAASGVGNALPWAVAAIALLALIALAAGQRFGRGPQPQAPLSSLTGSPLGGGARAPDISSLSPEERAERLYDRIMGAAERGRVDSVQFFMPMAMQAYAALGTLNADQRYDMGRLAEVAGDPGIAGAQADSILREQPQHLLGLLLASLAARMRGDEVEARRFLERLSRAETAERRKQLPEYLLHQSDIDAALAGWRQQGGR
ncbi:MAG: zinc ribbon domain-containing protein [Gemmatimonadaceae bacterium]